MGRVVFLQRIMYEFGAPPLLAALLESRGYDVVLRIGESVHQFVPHIANGDIVAFSIMSDEEKWALSVASGLKQIFDVTIIMGGPHPTFFPNIVEHPAVDFVCRGEGESAIVDLANHIFKGMEDIESIKNIGYKKEGNVLLNEIAHLIEDLGASPYPDRTLYYDSFAQLRTNNLKPFTAGRGCPYGCTFCFNEQYRRIYKGKGRYVRYRPVPHLIGEIEHVSKTYGLQSVLFTDDVFILNRQWLGEFCEQYKRAINLPYVCCVRADLLDEEIVSMLSESGCYSVYFGIESGNEEIRIRLLKKKISNEQIVRAAELLHQHSIKFMTFNIIGSPGETAENVYETIEINQRIHPDFPRCSLMAYFPGTEITKYAQEHGYLPENFELSPFAQQLVPDEKVHNGEIQNLHNFFQTVVLFPALYPMLKRFAKLPPNIFFRAWWALIYFWVFCRGENRNILQMLRFGAGYLRGLIFGSRQSSISSDPFSCPSCGNSNAKTVFATEEMRVVRCKKCHMESLNPRPDDVVYEKDYYDVWGGEKHEAEISGLKEKTSELLLDYLDLKPGASILEVGCAKGDLVGVACRKGNTVTGIDVNAYAIERAQKRGFPAEFFACDIEGVLRRGKLFDAVVLVDVLEHIPTPNVFLRSINALLHEGGLILIVTPNVDGLIRTISGKSWPHYKKEHLYYYSEKTLLPMLERAGFEHLRSSAMKKALNIRYIAAQFRRYGRSTALRHLLKMFRLFENTSLYRRPLWLKDGTFVLVARKKSRISKGAERALHSLFTKVS